MVGNLDMVPLDSLEQAAGPAPRSRAHEDGAADLRNRIPKLERRKKREPCIQTPTPETPALPSPPETVTFKTPKRRILSRHDHELFLASPTHELIIAFVFALADAVVDTPVSAVKNDNEGLGPGPAVNTILRLLDETEQLCRDSPPDEQGGSRFGNKRFRDFLDKVKARAPWWHSRLGISDPGAVAEVSTYLNQSFGNRRRIDYGSGHELNFFIWLLSLYQLSILEPSHFRALVLAVFSRYLGVMRLVQTTYYLEPAGSHGVWGLDDYQFLPFLFGASQLLHHPFITPRAIHSELTIEEFGHEYLYLDQVGFVNSTKTVKGLRWHSPMLDDISSARSWAKIGAGMRRMFVAEVLGKLPVMQHFLFGALMPAVEGMSGQDGAGLSDEEDEEDEDEGGKLDVFDRDGVRHVHQPSGWGDCCGIKVPSSVAAAAEMRKRGTGESLRRIPFD